MTKLLKEAIAEAETLSEPAQDRIGRELSAHVKKLRALRADLQRGIDSLDAGAGRGLDVEQVIARARVVPQGRPPARAQAWMMKDTKLQSHVLGDWSACVRSSDA